MLTMQTKWLKKKRYRFGDSLHYERNVIFYPHSTYQTSHHRAATTSITPFAEPHGFVSRFGNVFWSIPLPRALKRFLRRYSFHLPFNRLPCDRGFSASVCDPSPSRHYCTVCQKSKVFSSHAVSSGFRARSPSLLIWRVFFFSYGFSFFFCLLGALQLHTLTQRKNQIIGTLLEIGVYDRLKLNLRYREYNSKLHF